MNDTFEAKLARLEEIAGLMNSEKTSLEDSIKLFKEGSKLASEARGLLSKAELEIRKFSEGEEHSEGEKSSEGGKSE